MLPTLAPISGHAKVILDTAIHVSANEKSILLDSLMPGNVVEVLGQVVDKSTGWTWHQIQFGKTEGYLRADTLVMMSESEYLAYLSNTPEPIAEVTPTVTALHALTAQPRSTWAGTPLPAIWVSSESPTPSPTVQPTPDPTVTVQVTEPTVAAATPVVTEAPKTPNPSNTVLWFGLGGLILLIAGAVAGTSIHRRKQQAKAQEAAAALAEKQLADEKWTTHNTQKKDSSTPSKK